MLYSVNMFQERTLNMKSQNFEFLRSKWPELAGLGGFAETYAHTDPKGSLAKLRQFGEELTKWIYHDVRLPIPVRANQIELLEALSLIHISEPTRPY